MACTAAPQPRQAGLGIAGPSHRDNSRLHRQFRVVAVDQQPSIRITFPAHATIPAREGTRSERRMSEAARESERVALATKRLRKWLKTFAKVFDYRPETISRLESERQRWPVVGMGPVHVVNRGHPASQHQQAGHGQPRPRRLRRQRDLIQRSDSGVSVKTLPRYRHELDDSEMMLYKSDSEDAEEDPMSSGSSVVDEVYVDAAVQTSDNEEAIAGARTGEPSYGLLENGTSPEYTESERRSELLDHFEEEAPAYSASYDPRPREADASASCQTTSRRGLRTLLRAPNTSASITVPQQRRESFCETSPRLRRITLTAASRSSSEQAHNFSALARCESSESGTATPPAYSRAHRSLYAASAPVTRNASVVSLLPSALQNAFAEEAAASRVGSTSGHDMQPSTPASRRQSLSASATAQAAAAAESQRNLAALTAALNARRGSLTPPVSGYSEQQLAFLASVEEVDWRGEHGADVVPSSIVPSSGNAASCILVNVE